MTRRSMSQARRARIFARHNGVCSLCSGKIMPGEEWEVEHQIPLALLGADDDENTAPAHKTCHASKTRADRSMIAKAVRTSKKNGREPWLRKPRKAIPSRGFDKTKCRRFSGEVVAR